MIELEAKIYPYIASKANLGPSREFVGALG